MAEAAASGQGNVGSLIRRWLAVGTLAVLAACQVVPKGPPKPVEAPPETGPVGPALPTDTDRHRIALLVPMTGTNAGVGEAIANAANLAVMDTGGKSLRVTTYDTAPDAAAAARQAIADGNKLILGPLLAEDVRAVAPLGRAARVPLISFSNDTSVAGNGTFILGFVPTQSVDRVVRYARSRGLVTFAGLVPNGTYGQRAGQAMIRAVEASGGRLVAMQNFDRTQSSMTQAVTKLALNGKYDAILIADSGRVALQIVPSIRRGGGATAKILGTELWNTEASLVRNPVLHGAWFASVSDGLYNQLAAKYRARYGKAPYRLASLGYDAVLLANKIAANWRVGQAFPASQLTDEGGFAGIDGAFRFSRDGVAERALEVQQINPTGLTVVAPAPRSFDR
jgi:ABC-type branched-subunit amino acid transport system substrate-binding protein